jgi:Pentapeptide repeats (8 copies)
MSRQAPRRNVLAWSGLLAAAVAVAAAGIYVIFWPVSDLIARHDVGAVTGRGYGAALQAARDAARGRLVAFGAGLFAAGALIYTARNFSPARQGQVTDRYTKALEQLGSDKGLEVQIGGIYALERIARDSPRDHPTIMEVLTAFIRDHSSEQWPPAEPGAEGTPERLTRPDVQAAVRVVSRRDAQRDILPIDLTRANLTRAALTRAALSGADLRGADLRGANLPFAHLDGANLTLARLTGADLTRTDLTNATLDHADLTGADLTGLDGSSSGNPTFSITAR